jgi:hypothetical protein
MTGGSSISVYYIACLDQGPYIYAALVLILRLISLTRFMANPVLDYYSAVEP